MERFIGRERGGCKFWAIFQHIRLRNWDICHTVGPTFVSCVIELYRWDWNHYDTHLRLSVILKTLTVTGQEFLEVEMTGREVRAIGRMMIKHLPANSCRRQVNRRAVCGHRPSRADDEFRSALCSVHSKTLSQTALHTFIKCYNH